MADTIAPAHAQPVPLHRQKDKVVALPDLPEELGDRSNSLTYEATPAIFEVSFCITVGVGVCWLCCTRLMGLIPVIAMITNRLGGPFNTVGERSQSCCSHCSIACQIYNNYDAEGGSNTAGLGHQWSGGAKFTWQNHYLLCGGNVGSSTVATQVGRTRRQISLAQVRPVVLGGAVSMAPQYLPPYPEHFFPSSRRVLDGGRDVFLCSLLWNHGMISTSVAKSSSVATLEGRAMLRGRACGPIENTQRT